jgi:hypothetical protein
MAAIQIVCGLVLFALIITISPAHGEGSSRSTDPLSASKAYLPLSDGLYPRAEDVDEFMHGDARNTAEKTQYGPFKNSQFSDDISVIGSHSQHHDEGSMDGSERPYANSRGSRGTIQADDGATHAEMQTLALKVFHTPRSKAAKVPHRVLNSTDPIYMTSPIVPEPEVTALVASRSPFDVRPHS